VTSVRLIQASLSSFIRIFKKVSVCAFVPQAQLQLNLKKRKYGVLRYCGLRSRKISARASQVFVPQTLAYTVSAICLLETRIQSLQLFSFTSTFVASSRAPFSAPQTPNIALGINLV
jgi:hypothetical protein